MGPLSRRETVLFASVQWSQATASVPANDNGMTGNTLKSPN